MNFTATFPFEASIVAALQAYVKTRETMRPDLRDRCDAVAVKWLERLDANLEAIEKALKP